ncbi:MAG: hypothetical protein OXQ28_00190 [Acidobacteriota bacterium]|nr:hypothetical protein [Acidobacteriota bacterium]
MRKAGIALVALAVLGWLFWRTVQSSLAEPYVVDAGMVAEWTLALRGPMQPGAGLLVLQPSDQFRAELFQQIFNRTMESMTSPTVAAMPLVLHAEYRDALGSVLAPPDVLQVAEESGVAAAAPAPVCIGVVRREGAGTTRQLYYAIFDAPEVGRFRQALARRYAEAGGTAAFEPDGFPLVVPIAASDADFTSWWPLDVSAESDCLAPLVTG